MKKILSLAAVALLLAGCAPAAAAVESEPVAVGNTARSTPEVREALAEHDMRVVVKDTMAELLDASAVHDTTFEFERDVLVCELLHTVPVEPSDPTYGDYSESDLLSDCLNLTISAHEMYAD